jgi:hypothetical protein
MDARRSSLTLLGRGVLCERLSYLYDEMGDIANQWHCGLEILQFVRDLFEARRAGHERQEFGSIARTWTLGIIHRRHFADIGTDHAFSLE